MIGLIRRAHEASDCRRMTARSSRRRRDRFVGARLGIIGARRAGGRPLRGGEEDIREANGRRAAVVCNTTHAFSRYLFNSHQLILSMQEVGGQAIIEGVMMKNGSAYSIAVRQPNGKIKLKKDQHNSIVKMIPFLKLPFLRGSVYLIEMLILGMKALTWSADAQTGEGEELSTKELVLTFAFALGLTIGIFILIPFFLASYLDPSRGFLFNAWDGFFRLIFFVGYVSAISFIDDVKRLFQYHGAEHKVVNCFEQKKPLTVKHAKTCSTLHPRCGTSFIMLVIGISVVIFSFIIAPQWYVKLLSRIVFIPVIAGISYELLKFSAKFAKHPLMQMVVYPGLALQKITTKEPTDKQLEVALKALKAVL